MKYYIADYDESPEDAYDLKTNWDHSCLNWAAEDAAEDYHSNHDGWESSWPLVFVLLDDDGLVELGRFSVEREARPHFSASEIRQNANPEK